MVAMSRAVARAGRVSNVQPRQEYLDAVARGVRPADICRAAGFMRHATPGNNDVDRLRRSLGITPARGSNGRCVHLQTMNGARAASLRAAILKCLRWVCDDCGDHIVQPGDACGFCKAERELGVAA